MNKQWKVIGIDLAWGYKMPDAIATGNLIKRSEQWVLCDLVVSYQKFSVEQLCDSITSSQTANTLIAVDAPLVCSNQTGARPVDRECSALYRKHEAGCHPVNLNLVSRPLELARALREKDIRVTHEWSPGGRRAIEVYPHPTMIHWFGIEKSIKYKKGRVAEKRVAFHTYQEHLKRWLERWPVKVESDVLNVLDILNVEWTKENEDKLDAFFCILIACWEVMYGGERSRVLGDDETGFIIIPNGV